MSDGPADRNPSSRLSGVNTPLPAERRNFLGLAAYQVTMRIGWIFKTESIIMPAFLDMIAGPGWLRGCLPMLNRFGQSVPPLLFARRLKIMGQKKWALFGFTLGMSLTFLALSGIWLNAGAPTAAWMPAAFLGLYTLFFVCTGLAQLANRTLQGKLIRPQRRGRLLTVSTMVGVVLAIGSAWWLLGGWLNSPLRGFAAIFAFTGSWFVLSAVCAWTLAEPADNYTESAAPLVRYFTAAARTLRIDTDFRRLAVVAMLFSTVVVLFPHYQALARDRFGAGLDGLMLWVIVQNAGTGLFSLFAGPLADRRGNRLVLRWLMFGSALTPILAIFLATLPGLGSRFFWLVFVNIGLTPIMFKTLMNYTLEISEHQDHPRYLGTLNLCIAAPFCISPLIGWLVDLVGFESVMLTGGALIAAGGLLTFRMAEPRHRFDDVDVSGP